MLWEHSDQEGYVYAVCFSRDDALVVSGTAEADEPCISIFHAESGEMIHKLPTGEVFSLAFTAAGAEPASMTTR